MYFIFSICGLIGGLLCCVGDMFLDLKGKGNKKLGTSKNIDSNWDKMAEWRFGVSVFCALFGVFGVGLGFYSIVHQIYDTHPTLGIIMGLTGLFGVCGGVFVHASLCIQAVIYKRTMSRTNNNLEIIDNVLEGYYKMLMPSFFLAYIVLMIADLCVPAAILIGALPVPKWMALLNSVVFLIIGVAFRKIDEEKFQDLPGIIMPSLGLAMIGLIGITALL